MAQPLLRPPMSSMQMSANARTCVAAAAGRPQVCGGPRARSRARLAHVDTQRRAVGERLPSLRFGERRSRPRVGSRGLPALCVLERGLRLQGEHLSPQLSKPMLKHGNRADRKAIGRDGLVSVILSASVFLGRLEEAGGLPPVSETCRKRF